MQTSRWSLSRRRSPWAWEEGAETWLRVSWTGEERGAVRRVLFAPRATLRTETQRAVAEGKESQPVREPAARARTRQQAGRHHHLLHRTPTTHPHPPRRSTLTHPPHTASARKKKPPAAWARDEMTRLTRLEPGDSARHHPFAVVLPPPPALLRHTQSFSHTFPRDELLHCHLWSSPAITRPPSFPPARLQTTSPSRPNEPSCSTDPISVVTLTRSLYPAQPYCHPTVALSTRPPRRRSWPPLSRAPCYSGFLVWGGERLFPACAEISMHYPLPLPFTVTLSPSRCGLLRAAAPACASC